jgi:hypothetical protein
MLEDCLNDLHALKLVHADRDESTSVHGLAPGWLSRRSMRHSRQPEAGNRTFLMSQNRTFLKSPNIHCRGQIQMSHLQLNRNVGFQSDFSLVSFYGFGVGRRSRPPSPHCFSTDFQNSMTDVGNINCPLFLQSDERLLRAYFLTAMRT